MMACIYCMQEFKRGENMHDTKVSILGTEYEIRFVDDENDPKLADHDGYCDSSAHLMVVSTMKNTDVMSKANIGVYQKSVLRHEIVHAFLFESGFEGNSNGVPHWDSNEEMVDWIAIQFPKINKVYKELELI